MIPLRIEAIRRKHPRHAVHVEVTLESDHHIFTGLTENLSRGGLFVATHTLLEVGTMIDVEFSLPGKARIKSLAVVSWVRLYSETSDGPPGMGLQFASLDAESAEAIRSFLAARPPMLWDD